MKANLYTVADPRPIAYLDGISGPITHPTYIEEDVVIKMVRDGFTVYQHNPYNHNEKVKVTRMNFNSINFKTSRVEGLKRRALNAEIRMEAVKKGNKSSDKLSAKKEESTIKVENTGKKDKKGNTDTSTVNNDLKQTDFEIQ